MQKTISTILLILIFFTGLMCQSKHTGVIADKETKLPIAYVNIGIPQSGKGTVSDEFGRFSLSNYDRIDTIVVSCIGYHTRRLSGKAFSDIDTIMLSTQPYALNAPVITASKLTKEVILGVYNENRGHSVGFGNRQLGTEVGAPIYVDKPTYIKSAHFVLNHAKGDSLLFRINIYDYRDNKVGEKLIKENIYYRDKQQKGTFSVDLEDYNLVVNHNIMLALEWLKDFDAKGNEGITFDTKKGRKLKGVYLKNSSNAAFEKLGIGKPLTPCFYLKGMQ
jgi:hypothetical protein